MEPTDDVYSRFDMENRAFNSSYLAVYKVKDEILAALGTNQTVIVEGFTGCGKTTQVPQFILDDAASKNKFCKIIVTQPRRIAAKSVADRASRERGWKLGSLVGYQAGLERRFCDDSRIIYMTTGVLLRTLINNKNLQEWTHVIIDEVHERDLDTDLLMLVLKTIMESKRDERTKVILMSATLNAEKFKTYFPQLTTNVHVDEIREAALIKVPHAAIYPIQEYYIDSIPGIEMPIAYSQEFYEEPKIATEVYDMAVRIIEKFDNMERCAGTRERRGAVLVFLPGLLEIETMYKACVEYLEKSKATTGLDPFKWQLLPLHSTIPKEDQDKVFQPPRRYHRKIILATNIAESSITVTDIKYVIDFCLTKSLSCDQNTNYTCLRMKWASKNQCIQRRGRCGRVAPGHCYRMVPKSFYDQLIQEAVPEMEKSSLESVVLHAKVLDMGTPTELLGRAIDPPKLGGIQRAVAHLKELGALTNRQNKFDTYSEHNGELTYLGRLMSKLPIDIRFGRLVGMGHIFGVLEECIIIAAGLSTKSPFSYPYHSRLDAYISKLSWSESSFSDCIALVHVYRAWIKRFPNKENRDWRSERQWARENLVQLNVMKEITNLVEEIKRRLSHMMDIRVAETSYLSSNRQLLLKIAIAGAFYPNYFLYSKPKEKTFSREVAKELLGREPFLNVVFQGMPQEQPTILYARHMLKPFEHGDDNGCTVPYIETAGSKVVLSFDPKGQMIGLISHGVYRAVKMRQLRQSISFYVLSSDDSYDELDKQLEKRRLKEILEAPKQMTLPRIQQRHALVELCYTTSPAEFKVILKSDVPVKRRIEKELKELRDLNSLRTMKPEDCEKGALALPLHDGVLYRARIELVLSTGKLVVYFMDEGILMVKKLEEVFNPKTSWNISNELLTTKALAIHCRLKECKALAINGGIWQEAAMEEMFKFQEKYQNNLHFEIFSVVEGVMTGDLMNPEKTDSLITLLRKKSLVDYIPETVNSKHNFYDLRLSSSTARESQKDLDELTANQGIRKFIQPDVEPPILKNEQFQEVTLRGPSSPLEISFQAQCRSSHLKQVLVDGSSVNCVALDNDYLDPCSRLLVAAKVGIAHRSGCLMARETTLMPAIPNLSGLLTLLFCPKLELRVDPETSMYSGALAGLGLDPVNKEPIYGDHDIEVMFDAVVDNDDIDQINEIRKCMNLILQSDNREKLPLLREKCQNGIINLLKKSRKPMDETWPLDVHTWLVMEADGLQSKSSDASIGNELSDVFMIHNKVKLT